MFLLFFDKQQNNTDQKGKINNEWGGGGMIERSGKNGVRLARSPGRRGKKRGEMTVASLEPKTAASKHSRL